MGATFKDAQTESINVKVLVKNFTKVKTLL
jgi:hypothetical protein